MAIRVNKNLKKDQEIQTLRPRKSTKLEIRHYQTKPDTILHKSLNIPHRLHISKITLVITRTVLSLIHDNILLFSSNSSFEYLQQLLHINLDIETQETLLLHLL